MRMCMMRLVFLILFFIFTAVTKQNNRLCFDVIKQTQYKVELF
jgi:hypothetical protein